MLHKSNTIIALFLSLVIMVTQVVGCGVKPKEGSVNTPIQTTDFGFQQPFEESDDLVLVPTAITLPDELNNYSTWFMSDGILYFFVSPYDNEVGVNLSPQLWSVLSDGTALAKIEAYNPGTPNDLEFPIGDWSAIYAAPIDREMAWLYMSGGFEFEYNDVHYGETRYQFMLINYKTGETLKTLPLILQNGEYVTAFAANCLGQIMYAIVSSEMTYVTILDTETGGTLYSREIASGDAGWIHSAFALDDGRFVLPIGPNITDQTANVAKAKLLIPNIEMQYYLIVETDLPRNSLINILLPETDAEGHTAILASGDRGIVSIPLEGSESEGIAEIANYALLDIPPQCDIAGRVDGNLVLVSSKRSGNTTEIISLIPTPEKDIKKDVSLKIAALYNPGFSQYILDFNKANPGYHIELKMYENNADINEVLLRMTTDIAAGADFDLIFTNWIPYKSLASKGLFEDLSPYLSRDNIKLLDGVYNSISESGKIYRISNAFTIDTIAASGTALGDYGTSNGWTFSEMQSALRERPGSYIFPSKMAREDVLSALLESNIDFYADRETGQVIFDSPDFIELLEYTKNFNERDPKDSQATYVQKTDIILRVVEGNMIGEFVEIMDIKDIMIFEAIYPELVYKGLPAGTRNGNTISLNNPIAIMSASKNKEAAWLFIKQLLKKSFVEEQDINIIPENGSRPGLPVVETEFNNLLKYFMKKPTHWYDILCRVYISLGWSDWYAGSMNYAGVQYTKDDFTPDGYPYMHITFEDSNLIIDIPPLTEEQAERLKEFVNSINRTNSVDSTILDIVKEETSWFFSGQRSAADTARIIQSRVSIFISEHL